MNRRQTLILAACCFFSIASCISATPFVDWKRQHSKTYRNANEEDRALANFETHSTKIRTHNEKFTRGEVSWKMGHNRFSDLSDEEFAQHYLRGLKRPSSFEAANSASANNRSISKLSTLANPFLNASLDLRTTGEVNAVRNQGQCGSCFAFSATASMESCYYRRNNHSIDLSEQQLVDCVYTGSSGCEGGWMPDAFDWIKSNGQTSEAAYPYTATYGNCQSKPSKVHVQTYEKVPTDFNSIKNALATYGVLAITVDADQWSYYGGGVFEASRVAAVTNHAVNLVGYGYDTKLHKSYWLVRNSWGSDWGEQGYIRLATTKSGTYNPKETFAVTGCR